MQIREAIYKNFINKYSPIRNFLKIMKISILALILINRHSIGAGEGN